MKTLEDLRPSDTPAYMTPAWIGCLQWAIEQPEIIAWFREETGNRWLPGRTALARMIDDATGTLLEFTIAFVKWANINIWGPVDMVQLSAPEEEEG